MRTTCLFMALICMVAAASVGNTASYKRADENRTAIDQGSLPKGIEVTAIDPKPLASVEYGSERAVDEDRQETASDGLHDFSSYLKTAQKDVDSRNSNKSFPEVKLYVTSWCGYCKKAKSFFQSKGVPFEAYDVERDARASKQHRRLNPRGSVPVVVIGERTIIGFSPEAYSLALGLSH